MITFNGTILAKSSKIIFAYLFGRSWFGYVPSSIYGSIRTIKCVLVVFLWVKTSTHQGAVFVDKMTFYLRFIHKQLTWCIFVHMSGNKQSTTCI